MGFGTATPFLTYYGEPLKFSVFVNERLPAYALVREAAAPEYGRLAELEIDTNFASGYSLVTLNTLFALPFYPDYLRVEGYQGLAVAGMVERHAARVALDLPNNTPAGQATLESILGLIAASVDRLRTKYRERSWIVPTSDSTLDRFTLRGAFALTHYSRRVFGARKGVPQATPRQLHRRMSGCCASKRICALFCVSRESRAGSGTPWPLFTVIGASGLVSFIAMALALERRCRRGDSGGDRFPRSGARPGHAAVRLPGCARVLCTAARCDDGGKRGDYDRSRPIGGLVGRPPFLDSGWALRCWPSMRLMSTFTCCAWLRWLCSF